MENRINLGRILHAYRVNGYSIFGNDSKNYNLNLIGIRSNKDKPGEFNDHFVCLWKYKGKWNLIQTNITTDPGLYWLKNPLNVNGTFILEPNQYRGVWKKGLHKGRPGLVQKSPVSGWRDNDKDTDTEKQVYVEDAIIGINLHDTKESSNWTASAGCQVIPDSSFYKIFMYICDESIKNWGNSFTYTLFSEDDFFDKK